MGMKFIFPLICMIGVSFYVDKITMRFKGNHLYKKRIMYKSEVDGFQEDALF